MVRNTRRGGGKDDLKGRNKFLILHPTSLPPRDPSSHGSNGDRFLCHYKCTVDPRLSGPRLSGPSIIQVNVIHGYIAVH